VRHLAGNNLLADKAVQRMGTQKLSVVKGDLDSAVRRPVVHDDGSVTEKVCRA
jgi:hypothetical protein